MRISVCVGNYGKMPYCVPGVGANVFCVEELCYCLKENVFLLDVALMNDGLLAWIERECGLRDLARALHPLVHRQGSLSAFVTAILQYAGLYDSGTVREVELVLKQGAGLSVAERRKRQADRLAEQKKYRLALAGYDALLRDWQNQAVQGNQASGADCRAAVWHNKGVAYTGLMLYDRAAECFLQAYELAGNEEDCIAYLAAKRMQLPAKEYVAFAAEQGMRSQTLELEKRMEKFTQEWERQPDYTSLRNRRELRGADRQRYYEDGERRIRALKDNYRKET